MKVLAVESLIEIGHRAARQVDGLGVVDDLKVSVGEDTTGRPSYFFYYRIDRGRDLERIGQARIRLIQRLRDELSVADDDHQPFVQVFDTSDWELLAGALTH